jgi:hypothetical protein
MKLYLQQVKQGVILSSTNNKRSSNMKNLILAITSLIVSFSAMAKQKDATPSFRSAQKAALIYATDNVFSDILDHDSKLAVHLETQDSARYTFIVTADIETELCITKVYVSKELGHAFQEENEQGMTCIPTK